MLPNPGMNFTPFDPLTAAELDDIVENVEALAAGTGLNDQVVTPDKLDTGAATSSIATSEASAAQTFADLATPGPAVTVDIGANGMALVLVTCRLGSNSNTSGQAVAGFAVSGATTVAAADGDSLIYQVYSSGARHQGTFAKLVTGLTPGSNTFTMKYRVTSDTGTFLSRRLTVIPL